ncbi:MAG TPA: hydrogenase maturation protease [Actinomycetota bacterium]|nr:hydrogenase maturation protease [Actinomycetota bacterium]
MKALVAGMGNVLRGDDGFGVVVANYLLERPAPEGVEVVELGIGGIHLVQQLLHEPVDALVVIDAVDVGRPPGTVVVLEPDVVDVRAMSLRERHDRLADMHYATPERAFMLARALDRLPGRLWIVGCQPEDAEGLGRPLSPLVAGAVEAAAREVRRLVSDLGIAWD